MLNYFFKRQNDSSATQIPVTPKQFSSKTEQEPLYAFMNKDFFYSVSKNFVECFYACPVENLKISPLPSLSNTPNSSSSTTSSNTSSASSYHLPGERKWLYRVFEYIHLCTVFHFDLQYIVCGCDDDQVRIYEFINQKSSTFNSSSNLSINTSNATSIPPQIQLKFTLSLMQQQLQLNSSGLLPTSNRGVTCISIVPNADDRIIVGYMDGTVRLWSLKTQTILQYYEDNTIKQQLLQLQTQSVVTEMISVSSLAFDEFRNVLSVGYSQGDIRQFELLSGKRLLKIGVQKKQPSIHCITIINSMDFMVFANRNKMMRVWDLSREMEQERSDTPVQCALYNLNRDVLWMGLEESGELCLYKGIGEEVSNVERKLICIKKVKLHKASITSLWYNSETDTLVTTSNDRTCTVTHNALNDWIETCDEKTKDLLKKNNDLQFHTLKTVQQMDELLEELKNEQFVLHPVHLSIENEKHLFSLACKAIGEYEQVLGSPVYRKHSNSKPLREELLEKLAEVESYIAESTERHVKEFCNRRQLVREKYATVLSPQFETMDTKELDIEYEQRKQILLEKHRKELEQLEEEFKKKKNQVAKEKMEQKRVVAVAYQGVKKMFEKRNEILDVYLSKQVREVLNSIDLAYAFFEKSNTIASLNHSQPPDALIPIFDQYRLICPVYPTNCSKVFKAIDLINKILVAIKVLPPFLQLREDLIHPNLIPIYEIISSDEYTFVVMKLMTCNLRRELNKNNCMSVMNVLEFVHQLLSVAQYIQEKGMAHRDIRPENILLDVHGKPHLLHLGLMKKLVGKEEQECGTIFAAPELHLGSIFNTSDLWSIACVMFHMLQTREERISRPLFFGQSILDILNTVVLTTNAMKSEIKEFVRMCSSNTVQQNPLPRVSSSNNLIHTNGIVGNGILLMEGLTAFDDLNDPKSTSQILQDNCKLLQSEPILLDFLVRCFQLLPEKRITLEKALLHPVFLSIGASGDAQHN